MDITKNQNNSTICSKLNSSRYLVPATEYKKNIGQMTQAPVLNNLFTIVILITIPVCGSNCQDIMN